MKKRIIRRTKETNVTVEVARAIRGSEPPRIVVTTTLAFFDHMLSTLARYAGLEVRIEAAGDLRHHVMEDVALALGRAIRAITPGSAARYGERTIPMDDALVQAAIDVGGRPYFAGELPNRLYTHVLRSFADALGATLHVRVLRGKDRHHVIEAAFKAVGLALRDAIDDAGGGIFSTKGVVEIEEEEVA
jgi:imidazoleglycerol-phosphate dehydratase